MATISDALQAARKRIDNAARGAARDPALVMLLAVSKTFPADAVRQAWQAGQHTFGESYVQEAVEKIAELKELPLEWHFIGPIQSNKTRPIAESFAWVHGIDRLKIAERLSAQRPVGLPDLQVCLQVNVSGEASKSGVAPRELAALVAAVSTLPRIKLRGLMAIPEPTADRHLQHRRFAQLRELLTQLQAQGYPLDTLSMGMSDDLEAAVAEGATIVRVGSAIFGNRHYPNKENA
ncbi:MAG: YggS family pyridoxal phosphate-dependent enzyme [Sulfuricella sp.]|nr:YggS family pyridoxal phosphate-dependent enzyme [Sulfuricella sp.]